MSQGDESADVSHKETTHTTVNWKRPYAASARPRDCAKEREIESRAQEGAGLGTPDNKFHMRVPEAIKFPQGEQTHCESNCCSHETLLETCPKHHYLLGSTCLDELIIASAHSYPTLRYISLNL